jgi:hypothetical protein
MVGGEQSLEHGNGTLTTVSGSNAEKNKQKKPVEYLQNHALPIFSSQMYYLQTCE